MAELFQGPDILSLIFSPQEYPEKGGITGFAEGFMGTFSPGGGATLGGKGPAGTTTTGGVGGRSYAPGMSGYGGPTGGTPGTGTTKGGKVNAEPFSLSNVLSSTASGGDGGGPQRGSTDNPSRALSGAGAYTRQPAQITPAPELPASPFTWNTGLLFSGVPVFNSLFDSKQQQLG